MGYVLIEEVDDRDASKRGKTLLGALAYVMDRNATTYERKHEYTYIAHYLKSAQTDLLKKDIKQPGAKTLVSELFDEMEARRLEAEKAAEGIEAEKEKNLERESYLHKALVDEGYLEWRNRSITIASYGRVPEYRTKVEGETDYRRVWQTNSMKTMEKFVEDFQACLPEGIPKEAFDVSCMRNGTAIEKNDVGAVTFNEAFEGAVREAIIKMTGINLARIEAEDPEKADRLKQEGAWGKALSFDDAQYLASGMPYVVETDTPSMGLGRLTIDVLRSDDPVQALKETEFNRQMPLMNISEYAKKDEKLRAFMEEDFGGSIGRTKEGYVRAMNICMGKYSEEQNQKVNIDKILSAIDREMAQGLENKNPELSR